MGWHSDELYIRTEKLKQAELKIRRTKDLHKTIIQKIDNALIVADGKLAILTIKDE